MNYFTALTSAIIGGMFSVIGTLGLSKPGAIVLLWGADALIVGLSCLVYSLLNSSESAEMTDQLEPKVAGQGYRNRPRSATISHVSYEPSSLSESLADRSPVSTPAAAASMPRTAPRAVWMPAPPPMPPQEPTPQQNRPRSSRRKPRLFFLLLFFNLLILLFVLLCTLIILFGTEQKRTSAANVSIITRIENNSESISNNTYYQMAELPSSQLIQGQFGVYWRVVFRDVRQVKEVNPFLFRPGSYVIESVDRAFGESFSNFKARVVIPTRQQKLKCAFYVSGSADRAGELRFRRAFDPQYRFEALPYLPRLPGTDAMFGPHELKKLVPEPYRNDDLPYLRGEFIRRVLSLKDIPTQALQGQVTPSDNAPEDRNVTIYMYVEKAGMLGPPDALVAQPTQPTQ